MHANITNMNQSAIDILHVLFKNKIYTLNGTAFEAFFTEIMHARYPNFRQVKPQGRYGDKKNDGFIQETGTYYQVYAPENIQLREKKSVEKLVADFDGLYKYWNVLFPIKTFYFVVNDKYNSVGPELYVILKGIEDNHLISAKLMLSRDLEDEFFKLDENDQKRLIGYIPSTDIIDIDFSVVNEVIQYLLSVNTNPNKEIIPLNPDFEEKIKFNNLSERAASYLRIYQIYGYVIDSFFEFNSVFIKENLRDVFSGLYAKAMKAVKDPDNNGEDVFFYIYREAYTSHNLAIDGAIFTLMAYYFEYCDIFKVPEP